MLRKQGRRSFTVEVKAGTSGGRTSIPAKPPRVSSKVARAATSAGSAATLFAEEVFRSPEDARFPEGAGSPDGTKAEPSRRVLPSLIVWEPPASEAEPEPVREEPLPRVRRVLPAQGPEEAPRRRGRPRKVVPALVMPDEVPQEPSAEPARPPVPERMAAVAPVSVPVTRGARIGALGLSRAERWKRRLPRACW